MQTTFNNLIIMGLLVRDDPFETLETTGFISYVVADNVVILTEAQRNDQMVRINYVQLILDEDGLCWVVQLEAFPEDPNNYQHHSDIDVQVYKLDC